MNRAYFAAGCFWGVEATFRKLEGVTDTAVGYMGGTTDAPTYEQVCSGTTGHAEALEVQFDPGRISYDQLLDAFWGCHDPTTLNRQGPDLGPQYRSAVFHVDEQQLAAAAASMARQLESGGHRRPIVTEITPASPFHRAEEYHQRYLEKRHGADCGSR